MKKFTLFFVMIYMMLQFQTFAKIDPEKKTIELRIGDKNTTINNKNYTLDVAPYIDPKGNRTLVPIRFISEAMGYYVDWDDTTKSAMIMNKTSIDKNMDSIFSVYNFIELKIGSLKALTSTTFVVGQQNTFQEIPLDQAPLIQDGRTMVPIRFISEQLKLQVDWDPVSKKVTIVNPDITKEDSHLVENVLNQYVIFSQFDTTDQVQTNQAYKKSNSPDNYYLKTKKEDDDYIFELHQVTNNTTSLVLTGNLTDYIHDTGYFTYHQNAASYTLSLDGEIKATSSTLTITFGSDKKIVFSNP